MKTLKALTPIALVICLVCTQVSASTKNTKADNTLSKQAKESALIAVNEWIFSSDHTNSKQRIMVDTHLNTRMALDGKKPLNTDLPINTETKIGKGYWYKLWESMGYDYPSMYKLDLQPPK